MSWPVYFLISGNGIATGLLLSVIATLLTLHRRPRTLRLALAIHAIGALLVVLSSSRFGITGHVVYIGCPLIAVFMAWQEAARPVTVAELDQFDVFGSTPRRLRHGHRLWVLMIVMLSVFELDRILETSQLPEIILATDTPVHVIGDSLSAPSDDGTPTWSELVSQKLGNPVVIHARAGATAADALKQATELPETRCCVLIEIGGNDLLGGVPSRKFENDLRSLLSEVCSDDRSVVMFELPLPPFFNGYARTQKRLCSEFNVPLISRSLLAHVLHPESNTVDSLHLSAAGHRDLAERIEPVFRLAPVARR